VGLEVGIIVGAVYNNYYSRNNETV